MTAIGHVQANIRTSLECPREGKSHWDHSDRVVLACLKVFTRKHCPARFDWSSVEVSLCGLFAGY